MNEDHELGWDDVIENDGADFITLPAGEYAFKIKNFERGRYGGGAKMGACNKAVLTVELDGGELGKATVTENLFLHSKCEGILCQFFRSIGVRKSGEKVAMPWSAVAGASGRCKVAVRKYKSNEGEDREINQVKSWLDPVTADFTTGTF